MQDPSVPVAIGGVIPQVNVSSIVVPTVAATPVIKGDTALIRGVRTTIQAVIGFFVGLFVVVWAVPGVPEAVISYLQTNWVSLALTFGVSTGTASFVWNLFRKNVINF